MSITSRVEPGAPPHPPAGGGADAGGGGGVWKTVVESIRGGTAVLVAVGFLIAFLVAIYIMWGKADDLDNETAWARWTFLLAGIEAVAFAGAGWLFGREVHRAQVESAQAQADQAQEQAAVEGQRAAAAEAGGNAMRAAIDAKREGAGQARGQADRMGAGGGGKDLDELALLAERLFPQ
jgi:hypothetical protein